MKLKLFLLFILLKYWGFTANLDSLERVVKISKNDSIRLDANNKLIWQYLFSNSDKALDLMKKSEKIAKKPNQEYGLVSLVGIKAIFFDLKGEKDSALFYFNQAYSLSKKHHFTIQENHAIGNLGMYHWNQGNKQKALYYFFTAIKQSEQITDEKFKTQDGNYNNIGLIYQEQNLLDKALYYHKKALQIRSKKKSDVGIATSFNNIGICYLNKQQYDSAFYYFQEGIQIAKRINNLQLYYQLRGGLASVYLENGNPKGALILLHESLMRPETVPMNNTDRVSMLSNISHCYILTQQPDSALYYSEKALQFQRKNLDITYNNPELYRWKGQAYFMKGNISLGTQFIDSFTNLTLKKFNDQSAKYLQELEVEYESEKRDKELAENQVEIQKRNLIILTISSILIVLIFLFLLLIGRKNARNKKIKLENQLNQTKMEMEAKEQLFSQRLEISRDLHDNIGSQLTYISSSVEQLAFDAPDGENFPDRVKHLRSFIKQVFQELRDTVWAMNQASINAEDLHNRTIRLIEQINQSQEQTQIKLELEAKGFNDFALNSKECVHILGIIKEALNNGIKHAQSTAILVHFDCSSEELRLNVTDNGLGFDTQKNAEGFGLENMKKRAHSVGGTLKVFSSKEGTTIEFVLIKSNKA